MKNIDINFLQKNNDEMVGLLAILVSLWLILYLLPELLVSLVNTLLGNFILLLSVVLLYSTNRLHGAMVALVILLVYRFAQLSRQREGFTSQSQDDFLRIQHTINKQKVFDMRVLETQASQQELDYFNQHGMWPWSQEVIALYEDAVRRNPYIRTVSSQAVLDARKTYNQASIVRILTYQSKEGQFLLNGVEVTNPQNVLPSGFGDFPYEAEMFDHPTKDVIRCNLLAETPKMERVNYAGNGLLNMQSKRVTAVDYNDLESVVPGFSFLGAPCNPCGSMGAKADYTCRYRLDKEEPPSSIWQYLWKQ